MLYFAGKIKETSDNIKLRNIRPPLQSSEYFIVKRRLCNLSLWGLIIMFYVVTNRIFPDGYEIIGRK